MQEKLIFGAVRRQSRSARDREETSSTGDKFALLRADLDRDKIREHVHECLQEKDKKYPIEELFVIHADMNLAEQESFGALYKKTEQQLVNKEWWMEFDDLWTKLWATGSVSKKLMAKNGCNPQDDRLPDAVEIKVPEKTKHELIQEFEKEMDKDGFEEKSILRRLFVNRGKSTEDGKKWNQGWGRFRLSIELRETEDEEDFDCR
ncbi:hypothetical protein MKX08_003488 [Trichoderma sp. CBMAI-0020]|nr:hypothetical protein MKX08_003488 [Trichoderma sp. CBMAI-0020]